MATASAVTDFVKEANGKGVSELIGFKSSKSDEALACLLVDHTLQHH